MRADAIKKSIARGLAGLRDPERDGQVAIRRVKPREEVYHGAYVEEAPDLLVNFARGYRVSWSSSMGGISRGHLEDNIKKWSGDHIIDPGAGSRRPVHEPAVPRRGRAAARPGPDDPGRPGRAQGPAMEGESLLS